MTKEKNKAAVALGSIKSDKKAKASRENGKKGGPAKWKSVMVSGSWEFPVAVKRMNEAKDLGEARASRLNGAKHKKRK